MTNWPETESAVQTMPAIAMTKNMPVGPETPKRSSTTEETMMVSMVMPETGLRAVVAIALAATEVKKKENSSVSARPTRTTTTPWPSVEKKTPAASVETTTPTSMRHDADVAVGALLAHAARPCGRCGGHRERGRR